MNTAKQFLEVVYAHDITEEYDRLDALCNRRMESLLGDEQPEVGQQILDHLSQAREHVWQARMLADERAGLRDD